MKSVAASLVAVCMALSLTACNKTQESTKPATITREAVKVEPPRKETGVNQAEEMLAKSAGDMLHTYAQMYTNAKGEAPASFHDFVVEGNGDGTSTAGLKEMSLEKCDVGDAAITCPEDTYGTVLVGYRLNDDGSVTTDVKSKF